MCKIGEFKLCTCSHKIDRTKPHWILERLRINMNEIDEVIIGMYTEKYMMNLDFIVDKLNK